jgi:hypothetical protein
MAITETWEARRRRSSTFDFGGSLTIGDLRATRFDMNISVSLAINAL